MREENTGMSTTTKWIITLLTCLFIGLVIAKVSINKDWEREQQNIVKEEEPSGLNNESLEEVATLGKDQDIQNMKEYLVFSGVYDDEQKLFELVSQLLGDITDDNQPWLDQVDKEVYNSVLSLAKEISVKHNGVESVSGDKEAQLFQEISKEIATEFIIVEKYLEKGFLNNDLDSLEMVTKHLDIVYEKKNELVSILKETDNN